ncbi:competence/damage-inducible protein A [Planococcus sp. CP5-4]|uniref:competence/damage-inducible protein A n=1 Tax=unclassified Planococcus (in: firmicutes) TaxID=2662419 RepID=UPI001C23128E|nr:MULTISPECIES: competence/damage-inducible protein A [unclassified Planococcus (in: firmicutes)]MBU9672040.1 competence/damage-inducible protein A [Planococcus sp. CP5-4_YE]MBV0907603.1 competence/damage-inducible protein A [Planococcus sp. CP5-4_UN]MBW6062770.1 competence/damage-inducible protein A [Planococcus sp. CP5-4]
MNAEIIAVGSELLLGQITNTNARFISGHLAEIGINVYYHTVVGDNPERLKDTIAVAESRADLIIFSGGLGPTKDDLTKQTIANHLGTTLAMDEEAMVSIAAYFERAGRPMTDNNKKQALVLEGCEVLFNENGMAPGMMYQNGDHMYMLLPGPPHELEPMFQFEAKPKLVRMLNEGNIILSHVLRFYGIGEAELEDRLQDILDKQTNPTIAPLASAGEVTLRITAKTDTTEQAWELIEAAKEEIMERVGDYLYGYDDDSLASKAIDLLKQQGKTISAAESLTAGLFQSELASVTGASAVLNGGVVVYNEQMKIQQLGMAAEFFEKHSVVSEETAAAMAAAALEKFGTDIAVSLTGAAGPDAHGEEPAGTVWIGIASAQDTHTYRLELSGLRNTNRLRAVKLGLYYLIRTLTDEDARKI